MYTKTIATEDGHITFTKCIILDGKLKVTSVECDGAALVHKLPPNFTVVDFAMLLHGWVMLFKFRTGIDEDGDEIPDWVDW